MKISSMLLRFLIKPYITLMYFRDDKTAVTTVEYAVVVAGVVGATLLVVGDDGVLPKMFTAIFNRVTTDVTDHVTKAISS